MADWQRTLDLSDVFGVADSDNDESKLPGMAGVIAERLKILQNFVGKPGINAAKQELVERFEDISFEDSASYEDFDEALEELYDWGDISLDGKFAGKKVCFVTTT